MLKKSILRKLFIGNLLIFILLFVIQIGFQSIYFEKFYSSTKRRNLQNTINEIDSTINSKNNENIQQLIQKAMDNSSISIAVVDSMMNSVYGIDFNYFQYFFVIETEDNRKYSVASDMFADVHDKMNIGDKVSIEGILANEEKSIIFPASIKMDGKELIPIQMGSFVISVKGEEKVDPLEYVSIQGKVIEKTTEQDKSLINQKKIMFNELLKLDNPSDSFKSDNSTYSVKDDETGINYIIDIKKLKNKDWTIIGAVSLQPVTEIIDMMNQFYILIFAVVLILNAVAAFVYSRTLSKPLIRMNIIANKIAAQDFNSTYEVKTKDELGQLGDALNRISKNLERKINELEEANDKLQQDYNLQLQLKQKEKEFIANISHELKTPLTVIKGYVKGLRNGIYPKDDLKHYDTVLKEVENATGMIQEMLELSKMESPYFKIENRVFDLWLVFLKVYDKLKSMADEKHMNVNYEMNDEAYVSADPKLIEQIISNLFVNAVKYSPEFSNINVNISDNGERYLFSMENENIHIPENELEKIWEPFYRIEKSRSKKLGGTGLGLFIVKNILDLHNSKYCVKNTQKGVCFYFELKKESDEYKGITIEDSNLAKSSATEIKIDTVNELSQ